MTNESEQHRVGRKDRPRVQIVYEVAKDGATKERELPFVIGVMADLAGKAPRAQLRDRSFVEIQGQGVDTVMAEIKPQLSFKVEDVPGEVQLTFNRLDDFSPTAVASQVESIRNLMEARRLLNEFAIKLSSNDQLDVALQQVLDRLDAVKRASSAKPEETSNG